MKTINKNLIYAVLSSICVCCSMGAVANPPVSALEIDHEVAHSLPAAEEHEANAILNDSFS